jgi:predicted Zn-dependent protease
MGLAHIDGTRRADRRSVALAAAACAATLIAAAPAGAQNIPLIRDDEIETLVTDYARPLLKAAGLEQGSVAMRLVNSKSFNAFVLDGRNVYIHIGTLMQAETPNQVIGVIAHELGHIDGAHVAAMRSRMQREQTRMLLLRLLGIGAAIFSGSGEAIVAADEVIIRGFLAERRQQESAADQAGLRFLSATRQSGRGMLETFERLGQQNRAFSDLNPYLQSHPVENVRIARLRDAVTSSPYYATKDPPELQLRHDLMRAKLYGFISPPQDVYRLYPASSSTLPARYARAIARNCSGNCAQAVGEIEALIRDKPDNPFFWELKGHVFAREGKHRDAVPALRKALQLLDGRSQLIKVELAKSLVEMNDPGQLDEAIRLLEQALERLNEDSVGFTVLARAYAAKQRISDADLAMAQAHLIRGDREQAVIFAKRARSKLQPGSRAWLKADDIINIKPQQQQN